MKKAHFTRKTQVLNFATLLAVGTASILGSMNPARASFGSAFMDSDVRKALFLGAGVGAAITTTFNPAAGLFSSGAALSAYGTIEYLNKEDRAKVDIVSAKADAITYLAYKGETGPMTPVLAKAIGILRLNGTKGTDREMAMHVASRAIEYNQDIEANCWAHPGIVCENSAGKEQSAPVQYAATQRKVEIKPASVAVPPNQDEEFFSGPTGAVEAK